jgi:hypothetical protein
MRPPLAPSSRVGCSAGAGPSGSGASALTQPPPTSWFEKAARALAGAALGLAGVSLTLRLMGGVGPGGSGGGVLVSFCSFTWLELRTLFSRRASLSCSPPRPSPHHLTLTLFPFYTTLQSASACAAPPEPWHLAALDWGDGTADGDAAGARICAPAPAGAVNYAGGRHSGRCGAAAGIPKVALLFLAKGAMPHDAMWAAWLEAAAGLVPADCATAAACADPAALPRLLAECGSAAGAPAGTAAAAPADPLARQGLFSVYVHVPKGGSLTSSAPGTPFTDRTLIAGRVATEWGGFTLASATKALMRAALADPANQRFALLSEACVPLYSPQVKKTRNCMWARVGPGAASPFFPPPPPPSPHPC